MVRFSAKGTIGRLMYFITLASSLLRVLLIGCGNTSSSKSASSGKLCPTARSALWQVRHLCMPSMRRDQCFIGMDLLPAAPNIMIPSIAYIKVKRCQPNQTR